MEIDAAGDDAAEVADFADVRLQLLVIAKKILRPRGSFAITHRIQRNTDDCANKTDDQKTKHDDHSTNNQDNFLCGHRAFF
jgi:hypothetical protein